MRNYLKLTIISIFFSISYSQQDIYRSTDDIKTEWEGYTSFQKEEMVSFCDFLFQQGYYERCLLVSFQILYKFPNAPIIPAINYYIARCYEETLNYGLARKYYGKLINSDDKNSKVYKAALYRNHYIDLIQKDRNNDLLDNTEGADDPYLMIFRGYAYMNNMEWEKARTTFISAQATFNHPHYDNLMVPLYQAIEEVNSVSRYNKYIVFLSSTLLPGGGQFLLKEWDEGQGILSSVGLMMLIANWAKVENLVGSNRIVDNYSSSMPITKNYSDKNINYELAKKDRMPTRLSVSSSSDKYVIAPLVIGAGIFITSALKSFKDTDLKNKKLVEFYIDDRVKNLSPSKFLDFPEPQLIIPQ